MAIIENKSFTDCASWIRHLDCAKLAINWKNGNYVTICRHVIIKNFWRCFTSLVKFSCLSKFHVNIITGSRVVTIFFYKGLTRNLEIGNTPVRVLPNILRLGRVRDTKVGTTVSNKILLNALKSQGYSFYRFWVTMGKPTGGKITSRRTQIRVKGSIWRRGPLACRNKNNIGKARPCR